ncbi:hypothetical protein NUW58_g1447 [Xylaria curta]|uniref:Uncharacterized protein n=1 Tax=Xylaria curta TaxID=42375 RepID=A0ACC1PK56_9PEZI|nr:hypothetical protein NUW58_g1447 [Xylaria curta]
MVSSVEYFQNTDNWIICGPSGFITETETFVPTTYSELIGLVSIITKITTIAVNDGTSSTVSTYSYLVGPGGVGWHIPSSRSEAPVLLAPPTALPGQSSSVQSSSGSSMPTTYTNATSPGTGPTSSKTSITTIASTVSSRASSTVANSTTPYTSEITSTSANGQSTDSTDSSSRTSSGLGNTTASESTSTGTPTNGTISSGITPTASITSSGMTSSEITSAESTSGESTASNTEVPSSSFSATSTSLGVTSTITLPPADLSTTTLSGTSLTANTWITTKDKDDHTTIVPVIVTGGGGGIVIWGVPPIPNVEFSFPNLPKFHLPCIKVFGAAIGSCSTDPVSDGPPEGDDDPTNQPSGKTSTTKETSTSTSECDTPHTVSNCAVQCAKATTIPALALHVQVAWLEQRLGTVHRHSKHLPPNTDDEEVQKRYHPRDLEKRGSASRVQKFGTCALNTGAAKALTRPSWPAVTPTMLRPDAAGKMAAKYSTISRYDRATGVGACAIPTITRLDAAAFIAAPQYTDLSGKVRSNNNDCSLDHAYEKSWIKDFFVQLVGTTTGGGKLSCTDLNDFFFPAAPAPATCQLNLLQPIWDSIASDKNLYFIAMSQYVNGDGKGLFFADATQPLKKFFVNDPNFAISNTGAWKWPTGKSPGQTSAIDTLRTMINKYFETVLLGALEMKSDPMLPLIDRTNNRIYNAMLQHDAYVAGNPSMFPNAKNWKTAFGANGIAGAYKDYMTSTVLPQITEPPRYLTDLWQNMIKAGITAAENLPDVKKDSANPNMPGVHYPEWQTFEKFANEVDSIYLNSGKYDWEYTFSFKWDINNKRQVDDDGLSCPLPSRSGVTSATGSPTSSELSQTSSGAPSTPHETTSSSTPASGSQTTSNGSSVRSSTTVSSGITTVPPTNSSTSAGASATLSPTGTKSQITSAPATTAPAVTIGTSTEKVDKCEKGYGTYSIMAQVTAPANAGSQRFYVPMADGRPGSDWEINFIDGFIGDPKDVNKDNRTDPRTVVRSWSVGTAAGGDPVEKGDGGKDMHIKWKSPDKANGTFVELVYVKLDQPLGMQEWGIVASGGRSACLPDACHGPPIVVSDDNGKVCKRPPCSTQITCEDSGVITPRADCSVVEDGVLFPLWYDVTIVANNFIDDGGEKLKKEEKGCGAMTAWKKHDINETSEDGSWTAVNAFTFTLPLTVKAGCVERAIASAGGPKDLHCINSSSDWVFVKR